MMRTNGTRYILAVIVVFVATSQLALAAFSENQLRTLSEPVALYPDALLFQMLPAATFPDQIVDAGLLVKSKSDAKLIEKQSWDESVKVIAGYPGVLKYMNDNLSWTKDIGNAFLEQNEQLLNTIQDLRQKAVGHGNLKSNDKQEVKSQSAPNGDKVVVIEPTNPEVIYVPTSTTTVVYEQPSNDVSYAAPLATFGLGLALGSALNDDDDHYYYGGPSVWYNHNYHNDWVDRRWDHIDDKREFRQDRFEEQQDFRNDRVKDRQDNLKKAHESGEFNRAGTVDRSQWNKSYEQLKQRRTESGRTLQADRGWGSSDRANQARSQVSSARANGTRPSYNASRPTHTARPNYNRSSSAFSGHSRGSFANTTRSRGSFSRGGAGMRRGGGGGFRRRG